MWRNVEFYPEDGSKHVIPKRQQTTTRLYRVTPCNLVEAVTLRTWIRKVLGLNLQVPIILIEVSRGFYPEDGDSTFLQNVSKHLPDYMSHRASWFKGLKILWNCIVQAIYFAIRCLSLSEGWHLDVVRGPNTPHDPESDSGGSLSSWQGHPSR
jgi:hypothetical protein